jgi:hypothetical protein
MTPETPAAAQGAATAPPAEVAGSPVERMISDSPAVPSVASGPATPAEKLIEEGRAQIAMAPYDADAEQTFKFLLKLSKRGVGTAQIEAAHRLAPLTDDLYVEFEKKRDLRISAADDGMDTKTNALAAAAWLYDQLYREHSPAQLKLTDSIKSGVVQDGLLVTAFVEPPLITAEEALGLGLLDAAGEGEGSDTLKLRCIFDGREVVTEHDMAAPSAAQLKRYNDLMTRAKLVEGEQLGRRETKLPPKARALGRLYDELCEGARGYAGRVPLHHKVEVVTEHLSTEQERVEGN